MQLLILNQIDKKFGFLPPEIEERIKAIKDFNKLRRIGTVLLGISDVEELKSSLR